MVSSTDNRLLLLVERIERLREERKGITDDIRDVFAEAKAVGYDPAILRKVIARREMSPDDRAEGDMLLEAYEAALGDGPDPLAGREPGEDAAMLAHALLAEQIDGLEDSAQAQALVEHVVFLLDIRAEIAELRRQEAERRKLAKAEGFLPPQLVLVVRWLEKCAKHGVDAMRAGEAVFRQYRGTVEARGSAPAASATDDPKLASMIGAPPANKQNATDRKLAQTMAWLQTGMGN